MFRQSKIKGKNKGSGLGIYLDENLASNKINKCCKLTEDIESLFIRIDNISKPLTPRSISCHIPHINI